MKGYIVEMFRNPYSANEESPTLETKQVNNQALFFGHSDYIEIYDIQYASEFFYTPNPDNKKARDKPYIYITWM